MKKFFAVAAFLIALATWSDAGFAFLHHGSAATVFAQITPGTLAPQSLTALMPNVSTDGPRCFDDGIGAIGSSTWGVGCDNNPAHAASLYEHCIAPTSGTHSESCQPPQQFYPTSGTGNGTVATIHYFSAAGFVYSAATPLLISGATQSNWNTPNIQINGPSYGTTASDANCPSSGPSITLTIIGGTNPFIVGKQVAVNGLTASPGYGNVAPSFGTWSGGTGVNPNGTWTVSSVTSSTFSYCTGTLVSGTLVVNPSNFYGNATQPWTVAASPAPACTGTSCVVSFANPYSCASSCVAQTTSIAAGQTDDLILAWHYGEEVPFVTYKAGTVTACVNASGIGVTSGAPTGAQWIAFEADGGTFVKVATPSTVDPRGSGVSGLAPASYVYCAQVPAASFANDGEHEIRVIGCPTVGYCSQLTSAIAVDGNSASSFWTANSHGMTDWNHVGITNSFDANFPNYDWRYNTTLAGSDILGYAATASANGSVLTVSYTQGGFSGKNPVQGQTVGLTGFTSTNTCTVTGGSTTVTYPTSGTMTLNLSGTCSFPTGSQVNISGIVVNAGTEFNAAYAWNGNGVLVSSGGVCTGGTCSITVPALSSATYASGGSVTANVNGPCTIASAASGSFTCNNLAATASFTSGSVTNSSNDFFIVGGNGDNPPPYTPYAGLALASQFFNDSFQLLPFLQAQTFNPSQAPSVVTQNATLCGVQTACGTVPANAASETLWIWRRSAGLDERHEQKAQLVANSAFYFYTNVNGTIKSTLAYADAYSTTAVASATCADPAGAFTPGITTPGQIQAYPARSGSIYCADLKHAELSLAPFVSAQSTTTSPVNYEQTLSTIGSCLVFSNTNNAVSPALYAGEPINILSGTDSTAAGTDSNGNATPAFSQWGMYWIKSIGVGGSAGVTLANRPGGPCINETPGNIAASVNGTLTASAAFFGSDLSFDSILLECNQGVSPACSNTHPEQYIAVAQISGSRNDIFAHGGWLNLDPDTAAGATQINTSMINGAGNWFSALRDQGGRLRSSIGSNLGELQVSTNVAVGPTLPITPAVTATFASCGGSSPLSLHVCETITYPAQVDGLNQTNGALWQAPDATGNPFGQNFVVDGFINTAFNCGTSVSAPCNGAVNASNVLVPGFISQTSGSVKFINDSATGVSTQYVLRLTTAGGGGTTAGTYTNVPLTGGSGTGALATITVAGTSPNEVVTEVTTTTQGTGYLGRDILSASSANIGGVTGFQATAFIGQATPTNLYLEFPAGTFAANCAAGNVAVTTTAQACGATASAQYSGTTAGAYPLFLFGVGNQGTATASRSSNCLQQATGGSPGGQVQITNINPAATSGFTNDVLTLNWSATSVLATAVNGFQAINECGATGTGPFYFANNTFRLNGAATDIWTDSMTQIGPAPQALWDGSEGAAGITGGYFVTNTSRFNSNAGFDVASYAWGGSMTYSDSACINNGLNEVTINCQYEGQNILPFALGGDVNSDGTRWTPITGAWDVNGTQTTCSGSPCINTSTRTLGVAAGTIPFGVDKGWETNPVCGITNLASFGSAPAYGAYFAATYNNQATSFWSGGSVTLQTNVTGAGSGCLLSTGNPVLVFYGTRHIDYDFWTYNADGAPVEANPLPASYVFWLHWKDFIQKNVTCYCGSTEGIFLQGANLNNVAIENSNLTLNQIPTPGFLSAFVGVALSGGENISTFILRGGSNNAPVSSGGNGLVSNYTGSYIIDVNGGIKTNFPNINPTDPVNNGYWGAESAALKVGLPAQSSPQWQQINGITNVAVFPTAARGTNPTTGLPDPAQPGSPWNSSWLALPWYGDPVRSPDSGVGSY